MATPPPAPPPHPSGVPLPADDFEAIVGELDAAERGFVLGVLLGGGGDGGATTTAALESPSRARCADALIAIGRLARAQRVRLTRALARDVVPAFPAGIEEVDPSYLGTILDDEAPAIVGLIGRDAPPAVQTAVTASLARRSARLGFAGDTDRAPGLDPNADTDPDADTAPDLRADPTSLTTTAEAGGDGDRRARDAVVEQPATIVMTAAGSVPPLDPPAAADVSLDLLAELRRAVLANVVTVPPPGGAPPRSWSRRVATLPGAELLVYLTWRGAEVLGLSLRGGASEVLLRSAALVGPPFAERLLAVARGGLETDADPDLDRAGARALVAATRPASDPRETLARLGARAAGARLVSPSERGLGGIDVAAAVGQRLPPGIAAELLAAAAGK